MLDALNEDCRRHILSYLPVEDIVRAERVCRSWQHVLLQYLRGLRIRIEHSLYPFEETHGPRCRIIKIISASHPESNWFVQVTQKLGPSIVASYCYDEIILKIVSQNCPNLEHLVVHSHTLTNFHLLMKLSPPFHLTSSDQLIHIERLKQIKFWYFFDITDEIISKFIDNSNLEDLIIACGSQVSGHCLASLKSTNMRSLSFLSCYSLNLNHILTALENMPELTKLELNKNSLRIYQNADLLLSKVSKLEELTLNQKKENIVLNGNIPEAISRLVCLKRLDLSSNPNVTDEWLTVIASGCRQLQVLNIEGCSVSARAVAEFCRAAGSALTVLNVAMTYEMDDNHVTACLNSCPKLETLDVSFCAVTKNLLGHLGARRHPLRIFCSRTNLRKMKDVQKLYPWLILAFDDDDNTSSDSDEDENWE